MKILSARNITSSSILIWLSYFVVLAIVTSPVVVVHGQTPMVQLTDSTFEHQTQASTGATTGSWLVLFHSSDESECGGETPDCSLVHSAVEHLMIDDDTRDVLYERGVVLAEVNVFDHKRTMFRFGIEKIPSIIYIHHGLFYTFPFPDSLPPATEDEEGNVQGGERPALTKELYSFIMSEFFKLGGKPIPPPPSLLDTLEETFGHILQDTRALSAICFVVIVFGLGVMSMATRATKADFRQHKKRD